MLLHLDAKLLYDCFVTKTPMLMEFKDEYDRRPLFQAARNRYEASIQLLLVDTL